MDKINYSNYSDWGLVRLYVTGKLPVDYERIQAEVQRRGLDVKALGKETDALIDKWAEMMRKPMRTAEEDARDILNLHGLCNDDWHEYYSREEMLKPAIEKVKAIRKAMKAKIVEVLEREFDSLLEANLWRDAERILDIVGKVGEEEDE